MCADRGLRIDGAVLCDGWNRAARDPPPAGPFQSISAGGNHNCGVRTDGVVECWGSDTSFDGETSSGKATPPAGLFRSVSTGGQHTCGIRTDGTAACWGSDKYGQSTPPKGAFASVSAGGKHTCGLRPNGAVERWGSNIGHYEDGTFGQATPPRNTPAA